MSLLAPNLAAQSLEGRVSVAEGQAPVERLTLRIVDSARAVVRIAELSGDLRFRIALPRAGQYTVHVLALGFLPETFGPVAVGDTGSSTINPILQRRRVQLDSVRVVAQSQCKTDSQLGSAWLRAWQQARPQLASVALITAHRAPEALILEFRGLEPRGDADYPSGRWDARRLAALTPRQSPAQDALTEPISSQELESYRVRSPEPALPDMRTLDPSTLATDEFLNSHCFGLKTSPHDTLDWLGVTFRPVEQPASDPSAVSGVLWLDAASGELRRLDYANTGMREWRYIVCPLEPGRCVRQVDGAGAGGMLEFGRDADDSWKVIRWETRSIPVATGNGDLRFKAKRVDGRLESCTHGETCAYRFLATRTYQRISVGGVVSATLRQHAADSISLRLYNDAINRAAGKAPGTVRGVVVDAAGVPIPGVLIRAQEPEIFSRSDSTGTFVLSPLRRTAQTLRVEQAGFREQMLPIKPGKEPLVVRVTLVRN
jgi:hypothetical protein